MKTRKQRPFSLIYSQSTQEQTINNSKNQLKVNLFSLDGRLLLKKDLALGENKIYQNNFEPSIVYQVITEDGKVYSGKINYIF